MTSDNSNLKKSEELIVKKVLKKIRNENFWIPDEILEEVHSTFSMWALEIVIIQNKKVFLTPAPTHFKKGLWSLPGGYNRWNEDINSLSKRIADREIGISVRPIKTLGIYKWKKGEHPYGSPLSIFILCKPLGDITKSSLGELFDLKNLPPMVPCQKNFLKDFKNKEIK